MNGRRALVWAIALAVGMACASIASAQAIQKAPAEGGVSGTVTAVNAAESTIRVKGPNDDGSLYRVDPAASILNGDTKIKLADIKTGWSVTVTYDEPEKGNYVAKLITVDDAPN